MSTAPQRHDVPEVPTLHVVPPPEVPAPNSAAPGRLIVALVLFGVALVLAVLANVVRTAAMDLATGIAAGLGIFVALLALVARRARWLHRVSALALIGTHGVVGLFAFVDGMFKIGYFSRGRQVRHRGRNLLPPVRGGATWTEQAERIVVPDDVRDALAAQWRENGRTEHASVAAFARLSLDLIALGAPPELLADANRDSLDEIRHAELCFSLARSIDGNADEPGPFPVPSRRLSRERLAIDSLVDGAMNEGVSARVVARLVKRCEEPAIAAMLAEIAADEGRHAAHGWRVLEWCVREGGPEVARRVLAAAERIPLRMKSGIDLRAADGSWEKWGIPGRAMEDESYAAMRANVLGRVRRLVAPILDRAEPLSHPHVGRAFGWLGIALGCAIAASVLTAMDREAAVPLVLFVAAAVTAGAGAMHGVFALVHERSSWPQRALGLLAAAIGGPFSLMTLSAFGRGRQIRHRGRALLPRLRKSIN